MADFFNSASYVTHLGKNIIFRKKSKSYLVSAILYTGFFAVKHIFSNSVSNCCLSFLLPLLRTQSAKNTIFAFPKTFTIFYLRIYYFKVKVRLILTLIMVILGNAEIADWVLSKFTVVTLDRFFVYLVAGFPSDL